MRPVTKGAAPRTYTDYQDAQPDLVAVLDRFCSYCDRFVSAGVHVEHKRPQEEYPLETLLWSNFLLACHNCNSTKGHRRLRLADYLWPDTDNTLRAFQYLSGGVIRENPHISKTIQRKAVRTIRLLGLDRVPGNSPAPTDRDFRWQDRRREWDKANLARDQLAQLDTQGQRNLIVETARNGIFSIWWTVFAGDVDMRRRLREAFIGTDPSCFDANENLVARLGGQI